MRSDEEKRKSFNGKEQNILRTYLEENPEVPGLLTWKRVKQRFDPVRMESVQAYFKGSYIVDSYANCKVIRNTHSKTITESSSRVVGDSKDYTRDIQIESALYAAQVAGDMK